MYNITAIWHCVILAIAIAIATQQIRTLPLATEHPDPFSWKYYTIAMQLCVYACINYLCVLVYVCVHMCVCACVSLHECVCLCMYKCVYVCELLHHAVRWSLTQSMVIFFFSQSCGIPYVSYWISIETVFLQSSKKCWPDTGCYK